MEKPFFCKECGQLADEFPVICKEVDREVDSEVEEEFFEVGKLKWYGYCTYSGQAILLEHDEAEIDASNTAAYLNRWARQFNPEIDFQWEEHKDGNGKFRDKIVMRYKDGTWVLKSSYYSLAQKEALKLLHE